jgi:hypothetical protein
MTSTQKQVYALQVLAHAHSVAQLIGDVAARVLQRAMQADADTLQALRNDCACSVHLELDVLLQAIVYAAILHKADCLL